ncbi:hypothetical protein BGZ99_008937 [Dissophora globulifera]|uniref:GATA-type domain-containing protein n=1 Tax=Dissophora globulifera TaxID=979702 RepID=A0A9P6UYV4_9FUNG|nr:hypothetical protein BGZ99_008937 [Dissophora globulifera]
MLTNIDGHDEELEVIGSDFSGSFEPRPTKARLPMRLPNLNYNYPEASVQNFSPGTSLVFNAYRGHQDLLSQPYLAAIEGPYAGDGYYHRMPHPLSLEASADQEDQRQQLTYQSPEAGNHSPYPERRSLERSPFRTPHNRQFRPYQPTARARDSRDYPNHRDSRDSREYRDQKEYDSSGNRSDRRSPGAADPSPPIGEQNRIPEFRGEYPPQAHPQASLIHNSSSLGQNVSPIHPTPPTSQHWRPENNALDSRPPHDGRNSNSSGSSFQAPPPPLPRGPTEAWDRSDRGPPQATAAVDIPQPRHRGTNYNQDFDRHESMDAGMQSQQRSSIPQHPQGSMPGASADSSGFWGPYNPRAAGPRYSLSRVNYRMIFEYASEIRECLIKGKVGTTDRLLYNAEILSKVFMGCRADMDPNAAAEDETALNPHQLRCTSCNIVKTPEWRKGPLVWGKMSRNKAALASAKRKLESGTKAESLSATTESNAPVTDDIHASNGAIQDLKTEDMDDTPDADAMASLDSSRKRGREFSTGLYTDDPESLARDEDKKAIDETRCAVESLRMLNSQGLGDQDVNSFQDHPGVTSVESMEEQTAKANSVSAERDASTAGTQQDKDFPPAGRKLELSFLLA